MNRIILTVAIIAFLGTGAFAQTGNITGTLRDQSDSSLVSGATIELLLQKDSSLVKATVSDSKGKFILTDVVAEGLIIRISTIGYQEYIDIFSLKEPAKDLGFISLFKRGKDLSTVTIISKAPPVVQKGDTSQYSANQYKVNPDATTEDLIKKMPGITVDKDGTVTAQGEQVKKITIDGKDFFGDDASAALKNLPSEVVDKIQVFDRLSDQAQLTGFDDGNSQKAINIVTKTAIKNGQFGRAYAGYGTDERYSAGGNVSFFNGDRRFSVVANFNNINQQNFGSQDLLGITSGASAKRGGPGGGRGGRGMGMGGSESFSVGQASGISRTNALGLNYSDKWGKKINVTGSYFFNNSTNNNAAVTNIETLGAAKQFSFQDANNNTKNNNHRINLRLEYKIDSNNTLFIIPSINLQNNKTVSLSSLRTTNAVGDSVNNSLANSTNDRNGYNIRNNIMYRHSFPKKGRTLSIGFNTTFTKNDGESITDAQYRFYDSLGVFTRDSLQNQFADNNTNGYTLGGSVAYTEPIGKKGQLQIDYNPSFQQNKADQQTFLFDGSKYSKFDTTLSNRFDNTVTTQMQASVTGCRPARTNSQRIYPTATNVDQSFSNILPNAMWRKKLSAYSNIRVFYRAYTNFPTVTQLQDVVNLTNPLRVSSGNPELKQSFAHFLGGRYSYTNTKTSRSFFANIFMQTAGDYISNAIYVAKQDSVIQQGIILNKGSQLTRPVNLDGYRNLRTFLTYSLPVKVLKTTVNLNAGFTYSKLPGLVNYIPTVTHNYVYNGGIVLASNISEYVDFNLSYNANFNDAKTTGGSVSSSNFVNQSIGGTLNLLNKKGWFVQNDISSQSYSGLSGGLDQRYTLWTSALGKKFGQKKARKRFQFSKR